MVDSIEIRLDQLTQAIKGLYAKSSMSQGEIYNALTSLSQRYENLTNVSTERIAVTLVNEFKKTFDAKYGQTTQVIQDLENSLKSLLSNSASQNPKMAAEITKLLSDTSNVYAKLNSQDLALQKIFNTVDSQKNNDFGLEITKLSENFMTFSNGFENITMTLNKNFADFLEQIKQHNSKDELSAIKYELDTIAGNINSVISAISIIDTKYRDMTNFVESLSELKNLSSRQDLQNLKDDIKGQIEAVKYEIQKAVNTTGGGANGAEFSSLNNNLSNVSTNVDNLSINVSNTQDEVKNLQATVQNMGGELKNVHNLINDEILFKSRQANNEYEKYLNSAKDEIRTLLAGLTTFKKDISAINEGNIKVLQEPIERAMGQLQNEGLGKSIKELSENLKDVTLEIQASIQNMQSSLNDVNNVSTMNLLTQLTEAIPNISDKLEIFRTHVVTENSQNLGQIKTTFFQTVADIRDNLKDAVDKIQDDTKTINIETLDTLKVDLQRLSDHLVESVDNLNDRVQKEFVNFKSDFQEFSIKQNDSLDKISDKLGALEVGLEAFSQETIDKLNDTLNVNSAHSQDVLNEIKSDILESVVQIDKSNKSSLAQFEVKIDKILNNYIGADLDNIVEKKSLRETVVDIETKIDRTNLQQIHNAKELLEEIQSSASNLSMKIATIEESKNIQGIMSAISKLSDRLVNLEEVNVDLQDEFKEAKEQIDQKLKDNVQKISALVDKPQDTTNIDKQNSNIDNLSNKVQEYLSNFEYLKSNISQEIKDNLASEFKKIDEEIKKIKSSDESSNYTYTLEDIESDLAKIKLTVEKSALNNEDFKSLFEKIIELRTVTLENVKTSRDIESEIGHLTGWCQDSIRKIDDLTERVEDMQNIGFEDIKTRLIQSEKSKNINLEFNAKLENAIKHLIKYATNQDVKIAQLTKQIEQMAQAQQEGFNPSQFIDIFYENMTQTKMLSNRVEIIEDKINSIQNSVEKLISYVEQ